jgi:hypothetical protein
MKNALLIIGILLTLNSCSQKDDSTLTPLEQLPPATKTGKNTAGCLVNGEAFLPKGFSPSGNLKCFYINQLNFSLSLSNKENNLLKSLLISHSEETLEVGVIYALNTKFQPNAKTGEYVINTASFPSNDYYSTTPEITGELVITHHAYDNAIISGTFWFDAVNNVGEKVEVREGRFDMEY